MEKKDAALNKVTSERRDFLKKLLAGGAVVALPVSTAVVLGENDAVAGVDGKGKGKGGKGKGNSKGKAKGSRKGKGKGRPGGGDSGGV